MNRWTVTVHWYQHWRKFIGFLKEKKLSKADRDFLTRSALLANAEYVMSLAEEKRENHPS